MDEHAHHSTGWQLDRSAPEAYEQYLVPAIFVPWTERLLERATVREGDRVLDVACGTGVVARHAVHSVGDSGSVTGIDINEGMLEVAEQTAADSHSEIEWHQGDVTDLPFSDGGFDVAVCQQAIQFFDDPETALGEIRRVLAPGGQALSSVWRPLTYQPGYVALADALERHVGDEAGVMMRSPFPTWDMDYLRTLVRKAGFDDVSITIEIGSVRYPSIEEFVRREVASSPLAESIRTVEQEIRDALVQDVADELEGYTDDDGVVFPMESYTVCC
ncbi:methyltransferase domain-containing protein [Halostagnicola sp. A-GB9-2]|uniref:class I SAM-dependent methyltransferase n=1 Tax=Halostagnicola sp. A-GB9-2 TaxID=3048066 RepID=UPI0024C02D10|nr:methyltransferase domain-containing protein [Halostagnicola sp. A-GB9-2]MDJ1430558.1 methyltransferase domain-containing protein [Halostagnicola sp. A-GB9-2]